MEGWRCPGCGRCYSPSLTQCGYCGPGAIKYGTGLSGDTGNQSLSSCPNCGMLIVGDKNHFCNEFYSLTMQSDDAARVMPDLASVASVNISGLTMRGDDGNGLATILIDAQNRPTSGDSEQA